MDDDAESGGRKDFVAVVVAVAVVAAVVDEITASELWIGWEKSA